MSRSGYVDDYDGDDYYLALGRWRAQVTSATRGKRGQRFFLDLVAALDAMTEKHLIKNDLETTEGAVCGLGALGKYLGVELSKLDSEDHDALGAAFNIARQLAAETMYMNDERFCTESPEARWAAMRQWAVKQPCSSG